MHDLISHKNPSLYDVLGKIQKDQSLTEMNLLQWLIADKKNDFSGIYDETCLFNNSYYGVDFLLKISFLLKLKFD